MIKTIQVARELFEKQYPEYADASWVTERSEYSNEKIHFLWAIFLAAFEAAWNETKPSQYEDSTGCVIWDLDISAWESVKQAASETTWMPEEYYMNDWLADICFYLREGK